LCIASKKKATSRLCALQTDALAVRPLQAPLFKGLDVNTSERDWVGGCKKL